MSPAFFHVLTQKLFTNQLVLNILQRLSNKRRILNTYSWNDIPLDIKLSGSVDVFKSRLKTYLFRLAFN